MIFAFCQPVVALLRRFACAVCVVAAGLNSRISKQLDSEVYSEEVIDSQMTDGCAAARPANLTSVGFNNRKHTPGRVTILKRPR